MMPAVLASFQAGRARLAGLFAEVPAISTVFAHRVRAPSATPLRPPLATTRRFLGESKFPSQAVSHQHLNSRAATPGAIPMGDVVAIKIPTKSPSQLVKSQRFNHE